MLTKFFENCEPVQKEPAKIILNKDLMDQLVNLDEKVDFSDPQAVEHIKGCIEEKANDKLKDMLDKIHPMP